MTFEYKGYLISPAKGNPHSLVIATSGKGGKIPKVMEGLFTSRTICHQVIDNYLELKGV